MLSKISEFSVIVAGKEQISSNLASSAVILNLQTGMYYSLNTLGLQIWELIQQPKTVAEIKAAIMADYEVTSAECLSDILELLEQLRLEGLIESKNEAFAAVF